MGGTLDDDHLAAESADGLRHLHADRPASEHEQTTRHRFHSGDFTVRPDPRELAQTGHWRNDRIGARRDDDVLRRVAIAVDLDHAGTGEAPATAKQLYPIL